MEVLGNVSGLVTEVLAMLTKVGTWIITPANAIFMVGIAVGLTVVLIKMLRRFAGK